jgi:hypothetical protein
VCVVLMVLWVGSGWWRVKYTHPDGLFGILSAGRLSVGNDGLIRLHRESSMRSQSDFLAEIRRHTTSSLIIRKLDALSESIAEDGPGWKVKGTPFSIALWFRWGSTEPTKWRLAIPVWMLMVLPFVTAITAWRLDTLAQRTHLNHCRTCNYDRRGLPAASPCPECGAVPATTPT